MYMIFHISITYICQYIRFFTPIIIVDKCRKTSKWYVFAQKIHISYINRAPELIEPLINNITKFNKDLIVLDLSDTENENLDQIKSLIKECKVVISTINESVKITGINIKNNMGIKAAAKKINILGADNVIISDNEFNNEEVIDYL